MLLSSSEHERPLLVFRFGNACAQLGQLPLLSSSASSPSSPPPPFPFLDVITALTFLCPAVTCRILDNLPVAMVKFRKDLATGALIKTYERGYPVGFMATSEVRGG